MEIYRWVSRDIHPANEGAKIDFIIHQTGEEIRGLAVLDERLHPSGIICPHEVRFRYTSLAEFEIVTEEYLDESME